MVLMSYQSRNLVSLISFPVFGQDLCPFEHLLSFPDMDTVVCLFCTWIILLSAFSVLTLTCMRPYDGLCFVCLLIILLFRPALGLQINVSILNLNNSATVMVRQTRIPDCFTILQSNQCRQNITFGFGKQAAYMFVN